jgi:hypothetical protein
MDDTATPETGPVGASDDIDDILSEIGADEPQSDATDEVVAELVKDTEEEGQPETDPEPEESATDPTDEAEEPEESSPGRAGRRPEDPDHTVKVNGEEHGSSPVRASEWLQPNRGLQGQDDGTGGRAPAGGSPKGDRRAGREAPVCE